MAEMIPESLVGSGAEKVKVTFEKNVFQRFVVVEIHKEVDIPIAGIARFFGDDLDMSIKIKSAVSEPAEYIRTLDLGYLIVQDMWIIVEDKLGPIMEKFK